LWGQGLVKKAAKDWTYQCPRRCSLIDFKVVGPSYKFKTIKAIVGQGFGTVWAPTQPWPVFYLLAVGPENWKMQP